MPHSRIAVAIGVIAAAVALVAPTLATPTAESKMQLARFNVEKMDLSVDPRTDFLKFAAGTRGKRLHASSP